MLAAIRPFDVELPLFLHVLGAILLVGTLLFVTIGLALGWRRREAADVTALTRFGFWGVVAAVFPSYVLMRIGAQWTESAGRYGDDSAWIAIGYITSDIGGLLVLVSLVLSIIGLRRTRRDPAVRIMLGRIVAVLAIVMLAAYLVAVWAMTAKPA